MLLPRMCTSLPPYLPQLFYIFARALCWDQLRDLRQKQGITKEEEPNSSNTSADRKAADGWDCAGTCSKSQKQCNHSHDPPYRLYLFKTISTSFQSTNWSFLYVTLWTLSMQLSQVSSQAICLF